MPHIQIQEDESFQSALKRFTKKANQAHKRRWYKKRYGYYEKPSRLAYKRDRMRQRSQRVNASRRGPAIGLKQLFARKGPNAMGR
jgi:ribosomal protein S21